MLKKLKIMDWLVHGGHQYEFFKTGHDFYCTNLNGTAPTPEDLNRPANKNVNYIREKDVRRKRFDVIIVRVGVNPKIYDIFRHGRSRRLPGIAVMQTHTPFNVPRWVKCCVWNSKVSMDNFRRELSGKKHFYIPHGFDPNEFGLLNLKRNGRILSAGNVFKRRGALLGFDEWRWVSNQLEKCDLIGHGNKSLRESIGNFGLEGLVRHYNKYSAFLNTTTKSAMPRTRAEALMCGTPVVTTNNYGIDKYLKHGINCFFANNKTDMLKYCNKILESKSLQEEMGLAGREQAKKYFHIKDYLERWERVFEGVKR